MIAKRFTVIIPVHKRRKLLLKLLDSIHKSDYVEFVNEIIIVENGSNEVSDVGSVYPTLPLKYYFLEEGNKSIALNYALEYLEKDEYVMFFDDDVVINSNLFNAYNEAIDKFGCKYYYGGPMYIDYEKKPSNNYTKYLPASVNGFLKDYTNPSIIEEKFFMGCNWCCNKKLFALTGNFDRNFGPGTRGRGQETNMMSRMFANGFLPVYVPGAKVSHYVPISRSNKQWIVERRKEHSFSIGKSLSKIELLKHLRSSASHLLIALVKADTLGIKFHYFSFYYYLKGFYSNTN